MSALPVSVRLSLWVTAAFAAGTPVARAFAQAAPDAGSIDAPVDRVEAWRAVGEGALFAAAPRAGDATSAPAGPPEFFAAACDAGECVFSPSVGGALVPAVTTYGPDGDQGLAVTWAAYPTEPLPTHVAQAWSLRDATELLRRSVTESVEALEALDLSPWPSRGLRSLAERSLGEARALGLPPGVPPRAVALIVEAARIGDACDLALSHLDVTHSLAGYHAQMQQVRRLRQACDSALVTATNVGAATLAGWRPA
jgi:hypothetical protein